MSITDFLISILAATATTAVVMKIMAISDNPKSNQKQKDLSLATEAYNRISRELSNPDVHISEASFDKKKYKGYDMDRVFRMVRDMNAHKAIVSSISDDKEYRILISKYTKIEDEVLPSETIVIKVNNSEKKPERHFMEPIMPYATNKQLNTVSGGDSIISKNRNDTHSGVISTASGA